MQDVLNVLDPADYRFLVGVVESNFNFADDTRLRRLVDAVEADDTPEHREAFCTAFEEHVRYLGSSDIMWAFRFATGQEPGAAFGEIVNDVAKALKVDKPKLGTDRERVEELAQAYATQKFSELSPDEQQKMLEDLGVEREKAQAFIARSGAKFALPILIETFNLVIVEGLIKTIIFGTIAKIIGRQLTARLFSFLVGRLPWWVTWIGPAAWTLSIGWTALDVQGPAMRKTIPVVLYLGVASMRERSRAAAEA
ncbi:MAG: hypothetical protein JJ896_15030 [Rhodothermales bacterium]|nr:hypothetical protein [Rhodothermales bacterium]MBO6780966.1 hypothetical protein [Rhodothermales bacterium]